MSKTSDYEYSAQIFDLDGVVTSTAKLHFDGWKKTFDGLILSLGESRLLPQGAPDEFTETHYLNYVDGKPRYDGVRSFIGALGNNGDDVVEEIVRHVRRGSGAAIVESAFIRFLRSDLSPSGEPLLPGITPEKQGEMIERCAGDPAQLAELFKKWAGHVDCLGLLMEKLAETPEILGAVIVRLVGDIKDGWINGRLNDDTVEIVKFPHTIDMIRAAKRKGVRVALASSSKNAKKILKKAGLSDLFEEHLIIDGIVREEMGLAGKPAPDIFVEAAKRLGVPVYRAIVFEDANSGVAAGRLGNFGLVVGLARSDNEQELKQNGADIVLGDIGDMSDPLGQLNEWYLDRLGDVSGRLVYTGTPMEKDPDADPEVLKARLRAEQALQTVGNGFFCTRGADYEERQGPDAWGYAGTYFSTVRNTRMSVVGGQQVFNEDLANCINWLPVSFRIGEGEWFHPHQADLILYEKDLDFRNGLFKRTLLFQDAEGRKTKVVARHCVSMAHKHLAAVEYGITPMNYSGGLTIKAGLHGDHINDGVGRYATLDQHHLERISESGTADGTLLLSVQTRPSEQPGKILKPVRISAAARISAEMDGVPVAPAFEIERTDRRVDASFCQRVAEGRQLTLHKIVGLGTGETSDAAGQAISGMTTFGDVLGPSAAKWGEIWDKAGITVVGDRLGQQALNLAVYHLFVMGSEHNDGGIGPRGLSGETYRGHEFWDDILYYPYLSLQNPDITRSLLVHRYNGLESARKAALENGFHGAMYPWQAGIDGDEQTQTTRFNPVSGKWDPDNSCRQRHVSLAIAFNVLDFLETTGDLRFRTRGMEMVLEVCRFFTSMCVLDKTTGRYSISGVMGPNEFHEGAEKSGVSDNGYTNIMLAWLLEKTEELVASVETSDPAGLQDVYGNMGVSREEMAEAYKKWREVRQNLTLHISDDGVIANHADWFNLKGPDEVKGLTAGPEGSGQDLYAIVYDPGRSDRRIRAAGLDPDDFQIQKQADTLMAYYNLGASEVNRVAGEMGYDLPGDHLERNIDHHLTRTSHGSTLSFIAHAMVLANAGKVEAGWDYYRQALVSDLADVQGGTTAEGIHLGVMGGCLKGVVTNFAGLGWQSGRLSIDPNLPAEWEALAFSVRIRGHRYHIDISGGKLSLRISREDPTLPNTGALPVFVQGRERALGVGAAHVYALEG